MQAYNWRWRRSGTRLMLGCILAASVSACVAVPSQSAYRPQMPVLTIEQYESCVVAEAESGRDMLTTCVRLLTQEYGEIVTEFKAMCLALGHGVEYCQTDGVKMGPSLMVPASEQGGCFHEIK